MICGKVDDLAGVTGTGAGHTPVVLLATTFDSGNMLEPIQYEYGTGDNITGVKVLKTGWYKLTYSFQIFSNAAGINPGEDIADSSIVVLRDHLPTESRDQEISRLTLNKQGNFKNKVDEVQLYAGDIIHMGAVVNTPAGVTHDFNRIVPCVEYLHP